MRGPSRWASPGERDVIWDSGVVIVSGDVAEGKHAARRQDPRRVGLDHKLAVTHQDVEVRSLLPPLADRQLHMLVDVALQKTRAKGHVVAIGHDQLERFVGHLNRLAGAGQRDHHLLEIHPCDFAHLVVGQRGE